MLILSDISKYWRSVNPPATVVGSFLEEYEALKPLNSFVESVWKRTSATLDEAKNSGGSV